MPRDIGKPSDRNERNLQQPCKMFEFIPVAHIIPLVIMVGTKKGANRPIGKCRKLKPMHWRDIKTLIGAFEAKRASHCPIVHNNITCASQHDHELMAVSVCVVTTRRLVCQAVKDKDSGDIKRHLLASFGKKQRAARINDVWKTHLSMRQPVALLHAGNRPPRIASSPKFTTAAKAQAFW